MSDNQILSRQRMGDLLAQGFAVSAHLYNCCDRSFIVSCYELVRAEALKRDKVVAKYAEDAESVSLVGLNNLLAAVQKEQLSTLLFAIPQVGPFVLAAGLIANNGIKVATAFWVIGKDQKRLLERAGVLLLDLSMHSTVFSAIRRISQIHEQGYHICLLAEVSMKSRRRYSFMGYQVRCSSLIEALANLYETRVGCFYCLLNSESEVQIVVSNFIGSDNLTQKLLSWSEAVAMKNIAQYNWSEASIVFSDPTAYIRGLSFLPEIVEWRDQVIRAE